MDYHYSNDNSNSTVDSAIMPFHHQQPQQHHHHQHQQQHHFPYNNNQFHRPPDTLQLLTSPTNDIFNRPQQWNTHSNILSPSDIMDCSNMNNNSSINNDELNQPERGIAGFVSKLYQCLQAPDDGQKYARWCRHNGIDMFIIDCIPKFTEIVLPRLFKHCKFASFVRQLNIYGFQRDTDARKSKDSKDKETCRWHHTHFRPGRRDLFHMIRRKTPRYSRRKRPKTEEEEDPETILNVGSGDDESENNNIIEDEDSHSSSLDERRRSASSASSSITLHQQHHHGNNNITTEYKPRQLHMIFESPQEMDHSHNNNNDTYLQVAQQQSSSSSSSSPQYCHFSNNNNSNSNSNNNDINNDPHDLFLMQQTMTQDEEQLRSQIVQLRRGYLRMYKILTGEVNKAFNIVDVQKARIEFLENTLRNNNNHHHQQQMRIRQATPFIDTNASNNYFSTTNTATATTANDYSNNNIVQHHSTAPTTPIYPHPQHQDTSFVQQQQSSSSSASSRILQNGGYEFFFNTNNNTTTNATTTEDDLKLTSPCSSVVPEKWISTPPAFHHNTQISGLSSGIITTTSDS